MVSSSLTCSQFSILDLGLFSLHSACMVVLLRCVLDPCPQGQSSRGTSTGRSEHCDNAMTGTVTGTVQGNEEGK